MSKKVVRRSKPVARRARKAARSRPAAVRTADALVAPAASVPITVGVGASAGGLEAFSQLLRALGDHPGVAIIFIQHLAPQHESALPALLAHHTTMPVVQVSDDMPIEIDHVYVIPPNVEMAMLDGHLRLAPRPMNPARVAPIDVFFRSLAGAAQHNAIGVVLSGTASDGAAGVRDIRAAGGFTIAQQPETARYDGMPRAAIATGTIDLVLSPEEIGAKLRQLRSPSRRASGPAQPRETAVRRPQPAVTDHQLDAVFALLLPVSGVDFALYKTPTISRRLLRRMALLRMTSVDEYIAHLRENPGEVHSLYQDLLIHVTRFFREPDSFTALANTVLPALLSDRPPDAPVRAWAAGCATGEEAYSLAMVLLEFFSGRSQPAPTIQVFGTDVSEPAIEHARNGVYPATIANDVSPDRLRRFFTKTEGHYRIARSVRDLCIFARQDLTRDPPFSRLDLIFCRNVLIYLGPDLQRKLLAIFHYALKPGGYLVLGEAETIGALSDLFLLDDKKHRFYRRRPVDAPLTAHALLPSAPAQVAAGQASRREPARDSKTILNEANQIILGKYGPPAVVIDHDMRILQFRGQTGPYLEPAPGEANLNLLKMAREGLLYGLRTAVQAARNTRKPVRKEGLRVRSDGRWQGVNVEVVPLSTAGYGHLLVLFESQKPGGGGGGRAGREAAGRGGSEGEHGPVGAPAAGARRDPRVPPVDHPGSGGGERRAAVGKRGNPLQQRGAAVHQRGARYGEGGAAVDQRGAEHDQRRAPCAQRAAEPRQQRSPARPRDTLSLADRALAAQREQIRAASDALVDARRQLEESCARYDELFEFSPVGYLSLDSRGVIMDANGNAGTLFGLSRAELVGRPLLVLLHPDDALTFADYLWRCRSAHEPFSERLRIGSRKRALPARFWIRFVPSAGAEVFRVAVVDMSAQMKLEEGQRRAEQAERFAQASSEAKDQVIAMLSHELRTPLTPILAAASALSGRPDLPADVVKQVRTIRRNAENEARLIDDLLDMTRIRQQKLRLDPETTDLHAVVSQTIEDVTGTVREKALRFEVQLQAERRHVLGDPARLRQVFANLLGNAVKFTPPDGRVFVASRNEDDRIVVSIRDTGVGMDAETLGHLFVPFDRLSDTSRTFGGLGLGLAIASGLVTAQGGSLRAASDGPEKGSLFEVEFPTVSAPAAADAGRVSAAEPAPAGSDGSGVSILLVEDHPDSAEMLALVLSGEGHRVTVASDVQRATELAANGCDLIISDLSLPDGTGFDLVRRLQQQCPIKAISLIGFGGAEVVQQSHDAGFAAHLVKPVDVERLIATIRDVIDNR